jgi:hypothetical protein
MGLGIPIASLIPVEGHPQDGLPKLPHEDGEPESTNRSVTSNLSQPVIKKEIPDGNDPQWKGWGWFRPMIIKQEPEIKPEPRIKEEPQDLGNKWKSQVPLVIDLTQDDDPVPQKRLMPRPELIRALHQHQKAKRNQNKTAEDAIEDSDDSLFVQPDDASNSMSQGSRALSLEPGEDGASE